MQKFEYYRLVEELFKEDITRSINAIEFLEEIRSGNIDKDFVNAVCMKQNSDFLNIYDAYTIREVSEFIKYDLIYYKKIEIGGTPFPDKCKKENNEILKLLPKRFEAEFFHNSGWGFYNDGYFELKSGELEFRLNLNAEVKKLDDFTAPLEVGTTESYTSFNHIIHDGSLARWPYHSKYIHLFYRNFIKPSMFSNTPKDFRKF